MRTLVSVLLAAACLAPTAARAQDRAGVPIEGFPNWEERLLLVLTNRARADPQADLADCPEGHCTERACYPDPLPPLAYALELNRAAGYVEDGDAARFHASVLNDTGTLDHTSPCPLHEDIGQRYLPAGTCEGTVACACQDGVTGCGEVGCTDAFERMRRFGVGGDRAENLAGTFPTPREAFYAWLWEPTSSPACGFTSENGHRKNILTRGLEGMGAGARPDQAQTHWVQDFGPARLAGLLVAGVHEPKRGGDATAFRVNFFEPEEKAPRRAWVNVGGVCKGLALERGSLTNGTWLASLPVPTTGCTRYLFTFETDAKTLSGSRNTW